MTDALGWRGKFGVLAPSTNTVVEPDFYQMTVPGVVYALMKSTTATAGLRPKPIRVPKTPL